jgi:hypothetical protein
VTMFVVVASDGPGIQNHAADSTYGDSSGHMRKCPDASAGVSGVSNGHLELQRAGR